MNTIRKSFAVTAALVAATSLTATLAPAAQATAPATHAPATRVTAGDLPRSSDLTFPGISFVAAGHDKGEGQAPVSSCQTRSWGALGANATFVADYRAVAGKGKGRADVGTATASIASFRSHAAALAAGKAMAASYTGCSKRFLAGQPKGTQAVSSLRRVTLPGGKTATLFALNTTNRWGTQLEESGVVVTGTHAEIVAIHLSGTQAVFGTDEIRSTLTRSVKTLA